MKRITEIFLGASDRMVRAKFAIYAALCVFLAASALLVLAIFERLFPFSEHSAFAFSILAIVFAFLGIVVSCFIAKARRPTTKELALKIEELHPELMDSLICAIEKEQLAEEKRGVFDNRIIDSVRNMKLLESAERELLSNMPGRGRARIFLLFAAIFAVAVSSSRFAEKSVNRAKEIFGVISPGISIEPGDIEAEINSDIKIRAHISRWEKDATIIYEDAAGHHRFKMNAGKDRTPEFTFYSLSSPVKYRVETPSLKSETFRISPYYPPKLEKAKVTVSPPRYTGRKACEMAAFSDISAPAGAKIVFNAKTSPENAQIVLLDSKNNARKFEKSGDEQFPMRLEITVSKNDEYAIRIEDDDGHKSLVSAFKIEAASDLPPVIEVIHPGMDIRAAPDSDVSFTVSSCDDYGIKSIGFAYSVSGGNTAGAIVYPPQDSSLENPPLKILSEHSLSIAKTGAKAGEVISCYFYASDNCEPRENSSRSELIFIEVKEPDAEMNADGSGQKEKIDIIRLIVELKRLIRLTYEIMSMPASDDDRNLKSIELTRNLAALRIEGRAMLQQILSKFQELEPEKDPVLSKFDDALKKMENAETEARSENFASSISNQQKALSLLTYVLQQLMKNLSGKGEGEGQGSGEQKEKSDKKDSIADRLSLKQVMERLNKTLAQLAVAAKRQDSINSSLDALPESASRELTSEIGAKQAALEKETRDIAGNLPRLPVSERLAEEIKSSADQMARGEERVRESRHRDALAHGRMAYSSLLSSMELLRQVMKKIVSDQIDSLAASAETLSKRQSDQSASSASAAQSGAGKRESKKMRDSQNALSEDAKSLSEDAQALAKAIEMDYPDAAAELAASLNDSARAQAEMKKAANALLYAKFAKASDFQKKAAAEIANFAESLRGVKKSLPKVSQEEIFALMQRLREAAAEMDSAARSEGGKADSKSLSKTANKIGRDLESAGENMELSELGDIGMALQNMGFEEATSSAAHANRMLAEADYLLRSYLLKFELQRRTELKRKTSAPPEKYRDMVEEYFKSLSE